MTGIMIGYIEGMFEGVRLGIKEDTRTHTTSTNIAAAARLVDSTLILLYDIILYD